MKKLGANKIGHQSVGAFGESAVEAELLRHGWIPANVNATVKNAVDFDIYALKGGRTVQLRVKACGPSQKGFQFSGFKPHEEIVTSGFPKSDFTILVRMMGEARDRDEFYIVPTAVVRKQIKENRHQYLAKPRKDGQPKKDQGHWTLYFAELESGEERPAYGLTKRWKSYLGNWGLLDRL